MKPLRTFALMILVGAPCLPLAAQSAATPVSAKSELALHGRIVLYDWVLHETTSSDDFVLKALDTKGETPYARVIYKPYWSFDAPPTTARDGLDRWAFVGKGTSWRLIVHAPQSLEERAACSSPIRNHKYEDETGSGEIPRFVSTPGSDVERTITSISSLPCLILSPGGLKSASDESSTGPGGHRDY